MKAAACFAWRFLAAVVFLMAQTTGGAAECKRLSSE
jgi:hypothetical protein